MYLACQRDPAAARREGGGPLSDRKRRECGLMYGHRCAARATGHPGFTLVELLVVIFIMVLLLAMTATAINFSMDAERIRGAARQLQSYLEGARDRAIYAKEPRGVRLLLDETNPRAVSSVVYIAPSEPMRAGTVFLQRSGGTSGRFIRVAWKSDEQLPASVPRMSEWWMLKQKGLLNDNARIRIPRDGLWYPLQVEGLDPSDPNRRKRLLNDPDPRGPDRAPGQANRDDDGDSVTDEDDELGWPGTDDPVLLLKVPFLQENIVQHAGLTYELELPPAVMPNQEPTLLARNIVIDLDRSRIPSFWRVGFARYTSRMDILFSPRGTVVGAAGAMGTIHLYLCDATVKAFLDELPPASQYKQRLSQWRQGMSPVPPVLSDEALGSGPASASLLQNSLGIVPPEPVLTRMADRLVVTIFAATGAVSCHPIDGTDENPSSPTGFARDPFRYAETGQVAGQ